MVCMYVYIYIYKLSKPMQGNTYKIWPCMVRYLHFRVLKLPLWLGRKGPQVKSLAERAAPLLGVGSGTQQRCAGCEDVAGIALR